jgi:hypothetical protein
MDKERSHQHIKKIYRGWHVTCYVRVSISKGSEYLYEKKILSPILEENVVQDSIGYVLNQKYQPTTPPVSLYQL